MPGKLGFTGAAVATTTGRGRGVAYQLWMLFGMSRIEITLRQVRFNADAMLSLLQGFL